MAAENITYFSECLHNVMILYRSKRIAYRTRGYTRRTKLGCIHWNKIRFAAMHGKRRVSERFETIAKTTGKSKFVTRYYLDDTWKSELVIGAVKRKEDFGVGFPQVDSDEDVEEEDPLDPVVLNFEIRLDDDLGFDIFLDDEMDENME